MFETDEWLCNDEISGHMQLLSSATWKMSHKYIGVCRVDKTVVLRMGADVEYMTCSDHAIQTKLKI